MENNKNNVRVPLRFNLTIEHHQEAWEKLAKLPKGEQKDYCIMSFLNNTTSKQLKN